MCLQIPRVIEYSVKNTTANWAFKLAEKRKTNSHWWVNKVVPAVLKVHFCTFKAITGTHCSLSSSSRNKRETWATVPPWGLVCSASLGLLIHFNFAKQTSNFTSIHQMRLQSSSQHDSTHNAEDFLHRWHLSPKISSICCHLRKSENILTHWGTCCHWFISGKNKQLGTKLAAVNRQVGILRTVKVWLWWLFQPTLSQHQPASVDCLATRARSHQSRRQHALNASAPSASSFAAPCRRWMALSSVFRGPCLHLVGTRTGTYLNKFLMAECSGT